MKYLLITIAFITISFNSFSSNNDSTEKVSIPYVKPDHIFSIQFGTGLNHYSAQFSDAVYDYPIFQANLQMYISKRFSIGLSGTHTSFTDEKKYNPEMYSTMQCWSLGVKADIALVQKNNFEIYVSPSIQNYFYKREYYNQVMDEFVSNGDIDEYSNLMVGLTAGAKWYLMGNVGVFAEAGYSDCMFKSGFTVRL